MHKIASVTKKSAIIKSNQPKSKIHRHDGVLKFEIHIV